MGRFEIAHQVDSIETLSRTASGRSITVWEAFRVWSVKEVTERYVFGYRREQTLVEANETSSSVLAAILSLFVLILHRS